MKRTIIALLAVIPLSQGAELVTDLRLDGNFTDAEGHLTFSNNQFEDTELWLTDVVAVQNSTKCVSVKDNKAAWNGTFASGHSPSTTSFAISLFVNAAELPEANGDGSPSDWVAQWIFGGSSSSKGLPKIGIGQDGQIKVSCHEVGGGINSGTANVITTGTWYQIGVSLTDSATTSGNSVWTLYINGEGVATSEVVTPTNIAWTKVSLFEGADRTSTSSGRFNGYVDDIQIYNVTDSNDAQNVMSIQAARLIPEPATATLSLLALAGLAARRRRK